MPPAGVALTGEMQQKEIAVRGKHDKDVDTTAVNVARRRFGGLDLPAAFAGMLAALGLTVLLAGLAGAVGSVGYQRGASPDDLSAGGLFTGLAILLLSFFVGGWVAGRMARYDGGLNGTVAGLLFVVLAAAVSGVGSWLDTKYDFFDDVRLPQWFSGPSTTAAVLSAAAGILIVLLAASLGGSFGSRYHRQADRLIATTRDQAVMASTTHDDDDQDRRDPMVHGEADVDVDRSDATTSDGTTRRRAVR